MRSTHLTRPLIAALLLLVAAGCRSSLEPQGWERVVGVIEIGGDAPHAPVQLPDVVERGVPFTASVVTFGSSTCTRADGADIQLAELTAEITPYDLVPDGEAICTGDLAPHPRHVTLRFDRAGEALVRINGRSLVPRGPAVYETRVTVHP